MTIIKNFTKMQDLHVTSTINEDDRIGALVTLCTYAGPMTLHFNMTPNQARYLAKTLIEHADKIEDAQ